MYILRLFLKEKLIQLNTIMPGSAIDKMVTEGEIPMVICIAFAQAVHLINYNIKSILPCSSELHQVLDI